MAESTHAKSCTFCGRPKNEVKALIPSQRPKGSYICNYCIADGSRAIEEYSKKADAQGKKSDPLPLPKEIISQLDEYVIGQDMAKKHIAAAIYKHYKRREIEKRGQILPDGLELQKSNILITGPSGSGKTQLARTVAKILNVPFYIQDATKLTQAGYVGDDVDVILQGLLEKCDWNVERAQWGICVVDEIDKIARKSGTRGSGYRDVTGEGVQQAILKLVEGGEVTIAKGKGAKLIDGGQQETITIDTTNILFICMGSFDGIQETISQRLNKGTRVGFGGVAKKQDVTTKEAYENLSEDDILEFGIIPELAGRLPILTGVLELTKEELVKIMTQPKDALVKQEAFLYEMDGIDLEFDPEALDAIAELAKKRKTGARALRSIVANLLLPYDLSTPGSDIRSLRITETYVLGKGEPVVERDTSATQAQKVRVSEG